jgi:hypothetical protein
LANYRTLTTITLTHNYFADGFCRVLEFRPTAVTEKLLLRNQLMTKPMDAGFRIIGDQDTLKELDDNLVLRFYAQTKDSYFAFYTREVHENEAPLYYSTQAAQQGLLNPAPFFTPPELADASKPSTRMVQPLIVFDVHLAKNDLLDAQQPLQEYRVKLQARALHWKYYFVGDLAKYDLEIQDLAAQEPIIFTNSNNSVIKNSKALLSQLPIMLSEAPTQRFQLKDKNNSGKVLLKRLPNAAVQRLGKEKDPEGRSILVAEIYINQ